MKKKSNLGWVVFLLLVAVVAGLLYWYFGIFTPTQSPASSDTAAESPQTVSVTLNVRFRDGNHSMFTIEMPAGSTLKDAMLQAGILKEDGIRDGMILTVCGETADYEKDGSYWGLRENTMPLMEGAETARLKNHAQYDIFYYVWEGN